MSLPPQGVAGTNAERTFIAVKPDGVQRGLIGNILGRFETKGFKLVAMKLLTPTLEQAQGHYADLSSKKFFGGLCEFFSSGPICAMVWEGKGSILTGRTLLGATNPADSAPGTIRGDLCIDMGRNICHGSDGPESAAHEINFWFTPEELNQYQNVAESWIYEDCTPAVAPVAASTRAFPKEETDGRALAAGNPMYATKDNDPCLGAVAPSLDDVSVITYGAWADKTLPAKGTPYVLVFWAQFHKPGYPFLPLYNELAKKYGSKVTFVAVSMDPNDGYATKFMEDEKKKYSAVFECDAMTMGYVAKCGLSEQFASLNRSSVAPVHSFLVGADGIVAWHQSHAEIGATVPTYIGQVESQIDHLLAGEPLEKNGDREVDTTEAIEEQVTADTAGLGSLVACDGDDY